MRDATVCKGKKCIVFSMVVLIVQSCFPSFESKSDDKLYLKKIKNKSVTLEWYFYSLITSDTPDYLTIQKNNKIDTICVSSNIANLNLKGNKILIGFYGSPVKYSKRIILPKVVMGYYIIIDSTFHNFHVKGRKFYKQKDSL